MIDITENFRTEMLKNIKNVKARVALQDGTELLPGEELISVDLTWAGGETPLLKTAMRKAEIKIDGERDIKGYAMRVYYMVREEDTDDWIETLLGTFEATECEYIKDEDSTKITAYDNMMKFYTEYNSPGSFPMSTFEYLQAICAAAGVTLASTGLPIHGNLNIEVDPFANIANSTFRDALEDICEVSATQAIINPLGELEMKGITQINPAEDPAINHSTNPSFERVTGEPTAEARKNWHTNPRQVSDDGLIASGSGAFGQFTTAVGSRSCVGGVQTISLTSISGGNRRYGVSRSLGVFGGFGVGKVVTVSIDVTEITVPTRGTLQLRVEFNDGTTWGGGHINLTKTGRVYLTVPNNIITATGVHMYVWYQAWANDTSWEGEASVSFRNVLVETTDKHLPYFDGSYSEDSDLRTPEWLGTPNASQSVLKQPATIEVRRNYVTNPRMSGSGTTATSWLDYSNGTVTGTRSVSGNIQTITQSTGTGRIGVSHRMDSLLPSINAGRAITLSIDVKSLSLGTGTAIMYVESGDSPYPSSTKTITSTGRQYLKFQTTETGRASFTLYVWVRGGTGTISFTDVMAEDIDAELPYFDGSYNQWQYPDLTPSWIGAANSSASVLMGVAPSGYKNETGQNSPSWLSTDSPNHGSKFVRRLVKGTSGNHSQIIEDTSGTISGEQITSSLYARVSKAISAGRYFWSNKGAAPFISAKTGVALPANTWTEVKATGSPAITNASQQFVVDIPELEVGMFIDIDNHYVIKGNYTGGYFDGNSPNAEWSGEPNNSASSVISRLTYNNLIDFSVGDEWGGVNSVVLGRSPQVGDDIYKRDEDDINAPTNSNILNTVALTPTYSNADGYSIYVPGESQFSINRTQPTPANFYARVLLPELEHGETYTFFMGDIASEAYTPTIQIGYSQSGAFVSVGDVAAGETLSFVYDNTKTEWGIRIRLTDTAVTDPFSAGFFDVYLAKESIFSGFVPFRARGVFEVRIENNQLIDQRREDVIDLIYDQLYGIHYMPFEINTEGLGWISPYDTFFIDDNDGNSYKVIASDIKLTLDGGIAERISAKAPDPTTTDYARAGDIRKSITNTQIIVDKQEQTIQSIVSDIYSNDGYIEEKFSEVYQDMESIVSRVQGAGGVNFIRNSVMYARDGSGGPTVWEVDERVNLAYNPTFRGGQNTGWVIASNLNIVYGNSILLPNNQPIMRMNATANIPANTTMAYHPNGSGPAGVRTGKFMLWHNHTAPLTYIVRTSGVDLATVIVQPNTWTEMKAVGVSFPDTTLAVRNSSVIPSGVQTSVSMFQLEAGSLDLPYFDGDTQGARWSGTANSSPSIMGSGLTINASPESRSYGAISGNAFTLRNGDTVKQTISVRKDVEFVPDDQKTYYTLSARVKKGSVGSGYIRLKNRNEEIEIELPDQTSYLWEQVFIEGILPQDDYFDISVLAHGDPAVELQVTDLMLAIGKTRHEWTQAPGEFNTAEVAITQDGITVREAEFPDNYTSIDALGFNIHYKKDGQEATLSHTYQGTEVTKLKSNTEISMPPMRVVPIDYGNFKGWAFVRGDT